VHPHTYQAKSATANRKKPQEEHTLPSQLLIFLVKLTAPRWIASRCPTLSRLPRRRPTVCRHLLQLYRCICPQNRYPRNPSTLPA